MSDKDFNNLMKLAQKLAQEKPTKEEALRSLVRAGILDENGNFTPPYASLEITPRPR
ncbi:ATP-binding protein [Pseudoflavitalea sp. X16]|uniref:ATP-binding protein n=1 Tax=Paraflavitalea devenefica TaxID=2716334 RepID=UPI00141D9BDF|nr:ATP-binding protein [Paraflavitalea devenefica]NII26557.1 ATP-binding protein [Paraflavitalea devenefica]